MTTDAGNVERRMARSAGWMIGLRLADRGIGLVSVLFLARLLVPADFGIVAMGTVVMGVLDAMTAFGFEMALIQRRAKDRERWDSAWTLNIILGSVNACILLALAPLAVHFFNEPRVLNVMMVLAASAFVAGWRNIGMIEFEQDLRFGPIVALALTRRLASFALTLSLAWAYGTYWSLLAGMVTGHVVDLVFSYRASPYRPRFSLVAWRDLFSFSRWLLALNVLGYIGNRGGDTVIGSVAGAAALGVYSVSYELANLPTTELVRPVTRAVFPGYAIMAAEPTRLGSGFLRVFSLVLLFVLPASAGIAVLAEPLVTVLLGRRWIEAIPLVAILAVFGGIRAAQANTGSVYLSLNRPQYSAAAALLTIVFELGLFVFALKHYPMAQAAWYLVLGSALSAVFNIALLTRLLALKVGTLLGALARPALGVAVMTLCLAPLRDALWRPEIRPATAPLALLILVACGAAIYITTVIAAWLVVGRPGNSPEQALLATVVKPLLRGKSAAAATER